MAITKSIESTAVRKPPRVPASADGGVPDAKAKALKRRIVLKTTASSRNTVPSYNVQAVQTTERVPDRSYFEKNRVLNRAAMLSAYNQQLPELKSWMNRYLQGMAFYNAIPQLTSQVLGPAMQFGISRGPDWMAKGLLRTFGIQSALAMEKLGQDTFLTASVFGQPAPPGMMRQPKNFDYTTATRVGGSQIGRPPTQQAPANAWRSIFR